MASDEQTKLAAELVEAKRLLAQREHDIKALRSLVDARDKTIVGLTRRINDLTGQRNFAGGAAVLAGVGLLALLGGDDE